MNRGSDILIVGGYGEVGGRLASLLEAGHRGRVVVGGRNPERAGGGRAKRIDVDDPTSIEGALDGVGTVVACVRQSQLHLVRAAIRRGLAYTSIVPPQVPWAALEPLRSEARRSGARIVWATGLAPGISSVLARIGAKRVGKVDAVETALLLSIGDAYGADSMAFLLQEIAQPYTVTIDGREEVMRAFEGFVPVTFPAPIGVRRVYAMAFSDQHYYPMTLGAKTAIARLALEPRWLASAIAKLTKLGARAWVNRTGGRSAVHGLTERLRRRYAGEDTYALVVDVQGGGKMVRSTLLGHAQAHATAVGASAVVEALLAGEVGEPGVWFVEQVIDPDRFLVRLAAHGLVPTLDAAP
jgi:saccharopine dehydrogenase-like NADP-dependent oxidoreductase